MNRAKRSAPGAATQAILRHWREAVPNDRLAHLVKDATRALSRALQMRLTKYAVSFGHWTFLRILWETDGLTQRELSEQAGVMESTTFSALKALEQLAYITRRRRPDSRKKVYIFLTPKGRALKRKLVPLAEEVNEIAVRGASPADIAATRRTLLITIENLARDEIQSEEQRRMPSTRELSRLVAQGPGGRTRGRAGWRQARRDRDKRASV
ncbi:MAG: MarR family transcriptional regulator [Bradyrhizobiaceae bacterium]|nr:MarR family transcriptional regulator [Bradyrhizobiaceae bacterium]